MPETRVVLSTVPERFGPIEQRHPFGRLQGVDVETFALLGRRYGRDGDRKWYVESLLDSADAASIEVAGELFARDHHSVLFMHEKITGADPRSFCVLSGVRAVDADRSYEAKLKGEGWVLFCDGAVCLEAAKQPSLKGHSE